MIHEDTIKLLRECDAGVHMGVSSIEDILDDVKKQDLMELLVICRDEHNRLAEKIEQLLHDYHDDGKSLNPIVQGMSWVKTSVKMTIDHSDSRIADLMTDGCNMGVKSLSRYLNQYAAADEQTKDIAKKLIHLESQLAVDLRDYL